MEQETKIKQVFILDAKLLTQITSALCVAAVIRHADTLNYMKRGENCVPLVRAFARETASYFIALEELKRCKTAADPDDLGKSYALLLEENRTMRERLQHPVQDEPRILTCESCGCKYCFHCADPDSDPERFCGEACHEHHEVEQIKMGPNSMVPYGERRVEVVNG